ncbi:MAG: 50S ribosomal protein L13 [Alphaproteobacteria bacterium GM7ARS4]|nr:50S ribosomal protein L13 [Alphaproteobacteria bacterium GM7ARS4]
MGKTPIPTSRPVQWYLIDAQGIVLGRMASYVATLLRGKHKAHYTPFLSCGDKVIIVNAHKVALTGRKRHDKRFYWHTGYPGGIKSISPRHMLATKRPERLVMKAVERMVKRGPLGRKMMKNLYVYAKETHPFDAHKPITIDMAARNPKNVQRSMRVA